MNFLQGYRTYIGAAIVLLGMIGKLTGLEWLNDLGGLENSLIELVGVLVVIYGRANVK
jgi:hypothetical protein